MRMGWSSDHPITRFLTLLTLAHLAEIVPGVDAAEVAVVPADVEGIPAHRLYLLGLGRLFVHRQQRRGGFGRLSSLTMVTVAVLGAGRARAGIAQPLEGVMSAMAVVPLDVDSGSGRDVHLDGLRVCGCHFLSVYRHSLRDKRLVRPALSQLQVPGLADQIAADPPIRFLVNQNESSLLINMPRS